MAARDSAWRLGDSGAIDAMFDALDETTALLLATESIQIATAEIVELRMAAIAVDGFDRAAVEQMTARLRGRAKHLAGNRDD